MAQFSIAVLLAVILFRLHYVEGRWRRLEREWFELAYVALYRAPERVAIYINAARTELKKMNLKDSQQLPLSISATDKFGNPTGALDQAPVWSVVDGTVATLQVADDGMSATLVPTGKLGATQVQVAAQADGKAIAGQMDVTVIPGDATQIVIQAGTPVDVAPAPVQA